MIYSAKHHLLPRARLRAPGLLHASLLILCAWLAMYALPVRAEAAEECVEIEQELALTLNQKMKRSDTKGLAERRKYLNHLFHVASRSCATMLLHRLQDTEQEDLTLYESFHYRLAPATQEELLGILKVSFEAEPSVNRIVNVDSPVEGAADKLSHAETAHGSLAEEPHETDIQCMQVQYDLTTTLSRKYTSSDKEGLYQRRKLLNQLARNTTPSCAKTLRRRLGDQNNGSELSELFHHKLAAPTRREILGVLDVRANSHAVVMEGEIELGITAEQVRAAAQRASRVLSGIHPTNDNFRSLDRLECIVRGIEANPDRFDDSYFPVAPEGKNVLHTDNPLTCYKKPHFLTGKPSCLDGKAVVDQCRKSFAKPLVNAVVAGDSDEELLNLMLVMEDDINRGVVYFSNMRTITGHLGGSENKNAMMCRSAAEILVPRMSSSRSQERIYNCYPDP